MLVASLLAACAVGYRGEAPFTGEHDLGGTAELRIELPDTPLVIEACSADEPDTCPPLLSYSGVWHAVAGTRDDARRSASRPSLVFERDDGFAALRAAVPLPVQGVVDLQLEAVTVPDDRDLDLRTGVGDVTVLGSEAAVAVEIDIGDVEVRGADGGLGIYTGDGDVDVATGGHADIYTGSGHVVVEQTGDPRDVIVQTRAGSIRVELASDADVDLEIRTRGRISVRTDTITTVTSGSFERRNGSGARRVQLTSPRGEIEVVAR